jgi:ubiquitin C-terminal hydrolase
MDEFCPNSGKYDLVANISHEGSRTEGVYKVQVYHEKRKQWMQFQDLIVEDIMAQMVVLPESFVQIWKRQE